MWSLLSVLSETNRRPDSIHQLFNKVVHPCFHDSILGSPKKNSASNTGQFSSGSITFPKLCPFSENYTHMGISTNSKRLHRATSRVIRDLCFLSFDVYNLVQPRPVRNGRGYPWMFCNQQAQTRSSSICLFNYSLKMLTEDRNSDGPSPLSIFAKTFFRCLVVVYLFAVCKIEILPSFIFLSIHCARLSLLEQHEFMCIH